jgi:carboxylate-amine ligase
MPRNSDLIFAPSEPLTLGVEVEIQILDEQTLDLKPMSPTILNEFQGDKSKLKAELFQSMLEINTGICRDAHDVRRDLAATTEEVKTLCERLGLRIASSGTHPFANYSKRIIYPAERYRELIDRNQWIARRLVIFGLHVHIGMRDGDHAILMNNALLHYLPLLLALSASSPFWHGEDTELASSRITFFEALPTGGHPCAVSSWEDFLRIYNNLLKSGAIRSPKDIWWDIRPSPSFGTLEIRICDGPATLAETTALTALIHALAIHIDKQIADGRRFLPPPDWILRENKWRASRHGLEASQIVTGEGDTQSLRDVLATLFQELNPIADECGYLTHFRFLESLFERGASYERQRRIARETNGDLLKVVDLNCREFNAGHPLF